MNAKSVMAAASLNDIFRKLGWQSYKLSAFPKSNAREVDIQYRSSKYGTLRSVTCDAAGLLRWLNQNFSTFGVRRRLLELLDRKEERETSQMDTPEIPNLFS